MPDQRRTPRDSPGTSSPAARRPGRGQGPAGRPGRPRRPRPRSGTPAGRPEPETRSNGGGRSRLTGRAAVLFLVLLVLLISYASSLRAWLQQRDDTAQARADVAAAKQDIADLEEQRERLSDPAYIESLARDRFGWLLPGESGYTVLGEDGRVLGGDDGLSEPSDGAEPSEQEWYAKVWGSVQAAGEEPPGESERTAEPPENRGKNRVVRPEGTRR